ncbi:MAG: lamin tail domain-containing protein, partial [Candidatus Nanohaloarchaea archaeon]
VTVSNTGPVPVRMSNWSIVDEAGNEFAELSFSLSPGDSTEVHRGSTVLNNDGDVVILQKPDGTPVSRFSYG